MFKGPSFSSIVAKKVTCSKLLFSGVTILKNVRNSKAKHNKVHDPRSTIADYAFLYAHNYSEK